MTQNDPLLDGLHELAQAIREAVVEAKQWRMRTIQLEDAGIAMRTPVEHGQKEGIWRDV